MSRTLLIDGDVFAYQASAASEQVIQWCEEVTTLESNLSEAKAKLVDSLATIKEKLEADTLVIALSDIGSGYWRRQVLPTYKFNRKAVRKPLCLIDLREWMQTQYDCKLRPMLEGDDVLGILSTHPTLIKGEKVIVSIDKDMKTIPGLFCRNLDGCIDIDEITEAEADYYHMMQTLTGDTTDGYKGCPGMGPKSAAKILDVCKGSPSSMWPVVVAAFAKAKLNEAAALAQARVARILRHTDYDYKEKKPTLWQPPTPTAATV